MCRCPTISAPSLLRGNHTGSPLLTTGRAPAHFIAYRAAATGGCGVFPGEVVCMPALELVTRGALRPPRVAQLPRWHRPGARRAQHLGRCVRPPLAGNPPYARIPRHAEGGILRDRRYWLEGVHAGGGSGTRFVNSAHRLTKSLAEQSREFPRHTPAWRWTGAAPIR